MTISYIQFSTATSGTVALDDTHADVQLIHDAASTAATLTITMPTDPFDGQRVFVTSALGVTVLSMSASVGSIVLAVASIAAGGCFAYMYRKASNKWYKVV